MGKIIAYMHRKRALTDSYKNAKMFTNVSEKSFSPDSGYASPERSDQSSLITKDEESVDECSDNLLKDGSIDEHEVQASSSSKSENNSNGSKKRLPNCATCRNHNIITPLKGHKGECLFKDCGCYLCLDTVNRRRVMAKQVSIVRGYKQEAEKAKEKGEKLEIKKKIPRKNVDVCGMVWNLISLRYPENNSVINLIDLPNILLMFCEKLLSSFTSLEEALTALKNGLSDLKKAEASSMMNQQMLPSSTYCTTLDRSLLLYQWLYLNNRMNP